MNAAAIEVESTDLEGALAAARERLEETRAREAEVVAKLVATDVSAERAQAEDESARADVDKLSAEKAKWRGRGDYKWDAWDSGGRHGPEPVLVPDHAFLQKEAAAQERAQRAARVLARRQAERAAARQELAAAKSATSVTEAAVKAARMEVAAERAELSLEEFVRLARMLRRAQPGLDTPLNRLPQQLASGASPRQQLVLRVLAAVESVTRSDLDVSLNELHATSGGFPPQEAASAA